MITNLTYRLSRVCSQREAPSPRAGAACFVLGGAPCDRQTDERAKRQLSTIAITRRSFAAAPGGRARCGRTGDMSRHAHRSRGSRHERTREYRCSVTEFPRRPAPLPSANQVDTLTRGAAGLTKIPQRGLAVGR